jgi:hypothetical protein
MPWVKVHRVQAMELFAAFCKQALGLFGLRVDARPDIENLAQNWIIAVGTERYLEG